MMEPGPGVDSPTVRPAAVAIGGSAGALDALIAILRALGQSYALPVVVVIHTPRGQPSALVQALRSRCALPVREAEDKEPLAPATVYVGPPDYHLLFDSGGSLSLSIDDPLSFSRPSIDVLFESAADMLGGRVVSVLLSGANADGATGMRAIIDAGGLGIVQQPDEATSREMPEAAIRRCPEARVLRADEIGNVLAALGAEPAF